MAQTPLGAQKVRANKLGMTLETYQGLKAAGWKWCTRCKIWHPVAEFGKDSSRYDGLSATCLHGRKELYDDRHVPIPFEERQPMGPARHAPRDNDNLNPGPLAPQQQISITYRASSLKTKGLHRGDLDATWTPKRRTGPFGLRVDSAVWRAVSPKNHLFRSVRSNVLEISTSRLAKISARSGSSSLNGKPVMIACSGYASASSSACPTSSS